jgi:aspartyl/asparaginyl-tRNA synthetase
MTIHQEFLKFEAVLAHCETRVSDTSLSAAMDYGREMQFFDNTNRLSQSGQLLAEMILPTIEGGYTSHSGDR